MMPMPSAFRYSKHANLRLAQRCVSDRALQILLELGNIYSAGKGCSYVQLPKSELQRLAAEGEPERTLRTLAQLQAVVSDDGLIVTCYHASDRRLMSSRRQPSFKYH